MLVINPAFALLFISGTPSCFTPDLLCTAPLCVHEGCFPSLKLPRTLISTTWCCSHFLQPDLYVCVYQRVAKCSSDFGSTLIRSFGLDFWENIVFRLVFFSTFIYNMIDRQIYKFVWFTYYFCLFLVEFDKSTISGTF